MVSVYKPYSEGDGNLVVLLNPGGGPRTIQLVNSQGQVIEESRPGALTNGGRPTYRFGRPGAAYQGPVYVRAGDAVYPIESPGRRYENVAPGRLDAQPQQSQPSPQAVQPYTPPRSNPLMTAAMGAPLMSENIRNNASDWLSNGIGKIRGMFGQGNVLTSPFTSMGTTTAAGTPSVSAALSGFSGTPAWASAINAAAPWAIGGLAGLKFADMMLNRETSLQKWRRLSDEAYQAGQTGGKRPDSLLNYFDVESAPQVAYDFGKSGNPLKFEGGYNAKDYQRQQQLKAKQNVLSEGFDEVGVRNMNQGPVYTKKQKAAQKILKPGTNSQVNMSNPFVLTDADRGR